MSNCNYGITNKTPLFAITCVTRITGLLGIFTSVRVPKGSPGWCTDTLASTLRAPSSSCPEHTPSLCTINTNSLTNAAASSPS